MDPITQPEGPSASNTPSRSQMDSTAASANHHVSSVCLKREVISLCRRLDVSIGLFLKSREVHVSIIRSLPSRSGLRSGLHSRGQRPINVPSRAGECDSITLEAEGLSRVRHAARTTDEVVNVMYSIRHHLLALNRNMRDQVKALSVTGSLVRGVAEELESLEGLILGSMVRVEAALAGIKVLREEFGAVLGFRDNGPRIDVRELETITEIEAPEDTTSHDRPYYQQEHVPGNTANPQNDPEYWDDLELGSEEEPEPVPQEVIERVMRGVSANTPNPPSVETAYYRKCIELKRRLNGIEENNDKKRLNIARQTRAIQKLRLERAFLLEALARKTAEKRPGYESESSTDHAPSKPLEKPLRAKRASRKAADAAAAAAGEAGPATDTADPADALNTTPAGAPADSSARPRSSSPLGEHGDDHGDDHGDENGDGDEHGDGDGDGEELSGIHEHGMSGMVGRAGSSSLAATILGGRGIKRAMPEDGEGDGEGDGDEEEDGAEEDMEMEMEDGERDGYENGDGGDGEGEGDEDMDDDDDDGEGQGDEDDDEDMEDEEVEQSGFTALNQ